MFPRVSEVCSGVCKPYEETKGRLYKSRPMQLLMKATILNKPYSFLIC